MKKKYEKPMVLIESFALSNSISAGCETVIDNQANRTCGMSWGRYYVFVDGVTGCLTPVEDGSPDYNGLCYHIPTETNNLFNSF